MAIWIEFVCYRESGRWTMKEEWPSVPRKGDLVDLPELGARRVEDVWWTQGKTRVSAQVYLLEPTT